MRGLVLFFVMALLIVSCGGGDEAGSSTEATIEVQAATAIAGTAGCDGPLAEPGEYEGLSVFGEVEQAYWLVVPESYAESAPAPLYLHLASGGGDHDGFLAGWRPYLDDLNGLMAMVNTTAGAPSPGRGAPETLLALIDQISADYCVDPNHIHVMGTSWSATMAERLACEAADRIASFVSPRGGTPADLCTPSRPVPLWAFTGDPDRATVTSNVEKWAVINGCDPEPVVEGLGSGVFRKTYQNCEADIVFYDIEGMGHLWPMHEAIGPGAGWMAEYAEVDYLDEVLQFFADHPMP